MTRGATAISSWRPRPLKITVSGFTRLRGTSMFIRSVSPSIDEETRGSERGLPSWPDANIGTKAPLASTQVSAVTANVAPAAVETMSRVMNMVLLTAFIKRATDAGTELVAAVPDRAPTASRAVAVASVTGTTGIETSRARAPSGPIPHVTPRRLSRCRKSLRPRAISLESVPSGRASSLAASVRRFPFKFAGQQGPSVSPGKPLELFVQNRQKIDGLLFRRVPGVLSVSQRRFSPDPPGLASSRFFRRPDRHAIQPVRQVLVMTDRRRPPSQNQEGCLKCILGGVVVPECTTTHAQNHRPVAFHENTKRILGRRSNSGDEMTQQLVISEPGNGAQ